MVESFWEDARYAARNLRRDPLLALGATLTLAVCIGANTTVFSVANSILIRPLPYPQSERIDWISDRTGPAQQEVGTAPEYFMLREQNRIFEEVAAFDPMTVTWTRVERPQELDAASASPSFFKVMGTQPMLGRYFMPTEEGPRAPPVVVLSYPFWQNRMGRDPQILGRSISLDRLPRTIVGVMPPGFDFPRGSQLWLPATQLDKETQSFPISPSRPIFVVSMIARRKPSITPQEANVELKRLTFAVRAAYPEQLRTRGFRQDLNIAATPVHEHLTGPLRPALLAFTGAVVLVLLIACANIANLLLARAGSRQRELAVRLALGSGRDRIVRQMLTESLVLAIPGGAMGIALAWLAVYVLDAAKPAILVRYPAISMDWRVLAFTIALMVGASILFGAVPALSAAGIQIHDALKSASLTHSAGRGATRLRKILVIAEMGVSLVLLIGAGLVARSFLHLAYTDLGFPSDHLLTFRINPVGVTYARSYVHLFSDVLDRLKPLPMVRAAALASDIPLSANEFASTASIRVVGRPLVSFVDRPRVNYAMVSPEYFQTLGIALRSGRIFDAHDFIGIPAAARPEFLRREAVVVNEALVRRIFPGEEALGQRLVFGPDDFNAIWTIVGVVSNIRGAALGADPPPMAYRCTCAGIPIYRAGFLVRTWMDPLAVVRAAEQEVRAVDRDQPISDVKTMDQRRDAAIAPERLQLMLLGSFAVVAILLAAAGVYGTMTYLVTRRTREIGIRMAMGARPADVLRMVLGETIALLLLAIVSGLGGAWSLTRYVRSMLYGVTALDPITFVVTSVLLAVTVLIASLGPTLRAVRVDPVSALREE